jgi:homoserine dehydrogenase
MLSRDAQWRDIPMILRLAIVGFGSVGQEFTRLLLSKREWLLNAMDLDVKILAIADSVKGSLVSKKGLDLQRVLGTIESKGTLMSYGQELTDLATASILEHSSADVMIELTNLNINTGQPAIDHVKTAFEMGMDVITTNKGPIAFAYDKLKAMATAKSVHLRFEGTVMDGTPVFNLVERTLPGCRVEAVSGILNSTTNFILTMMERGRSMEDALEEAKRLHFTEADPSIDIDGWDAAVKIAALANVLMDASTTPKAVEREGIRNISLETIRQAASKGKKIKLVANAERAAGLVKTDVTPTLVGPENPFWCLNGTSSALTLETDLMGKITIIEDEPTLAQTAYAILSDMLLIAEKNSNHALQRT